jgi:hypothetical protein
MAVVEGQTEASGVVAGDNMGHEPQSIDSRNV